MGALFNIGTRAMFAAQAQISTTAANISNANTPGYSRQSVILETADGQFTGSGFFGKGVNIVTVQRTHDAFLTKEAAMTRSLAAADEARLTQMRRLEEVFDLGEAGLGYSASQMLNSLADVASQPTDPSARQVVLSRLQEMVSRFSAASGELSSLQSGVTQDLKTSLTKANEIGANIASLNQQIARVKGLGHEPNDLLDQRDNLIAQLSSYIQVTQIPADDGTVGVFLANGQRFVLGSSALELQLVPDEYDNSVMRLGVNEAGSTRMLQEDGLGGGSITGLLKFQRNDLPLAENLVGRMARVLAMELNQQQSLGLDQNGQTGGALLGVAAPRSLPSLNNEGDGLIALDITNSAQLQASDYEMRFLGGAWSVTRLSDGAITSPYTMGTEIDGMTLNVSGTPLDGDRFLLQPVRTAAREIVRELDDPRGLAAASPVMAEVPASNLGSVSVLSLAATQSLTDNPGLTSPRTVSFLQTNGTNAATSFVDGFGVTVNLQPGEIAYSIDGGATQVVAPGQTINENGWAMAIKGTPQAGDVINVGAASLTSVNNGNALAMLGLRDIQMVNGETITDAYASAVAEVGVRVQSARTVSEMSAAIAKDADSARNEVSGVNLDEEAARLIQFQQSYQAAAKVLQVAQAVFDILLETAT